MGSVDSSHNCKEVKNAQLYPMWLAAMQETDSGVETRRPSRISTEKPDAEPKRQVVSARVFAAQRLHPLRQDLCPNQK